VPTVLNKYVHEEAVDGIKQKLLQMVMRIMTSGAFKDNEAAMELLVSCAISFSS